MKKLLFVGAGLSCSVLAERFASTGFFECDVIDKREHVGGNCFTHLDAETGITVHKYGPHIFNTSNQAVVDYLSRFIDFRPIHHAVKASLPGNGVFSLPINLHTINQFFGKNFSPFEAEIFVKSLSDKSIVSPSNFEEQALSMIGQDLYEAFFKGYTLKQWGVSPTLLPASILKRLPVRFNYNDSYYSSSFVAMPATGYTPLFEKLLDNPRIHVYLGTNYTQSMASDYDHVFYSGSIDQFFDYRYGRLSYRTVYWERQKERGDFQGCSVMNYPTLDFSHTRISEHKYFEPWKNNDNTLVFTEYSKKTSEQDEPYYPMRLADDLDKYNCYANDAKLLPKTTFIGRLGKYKYYDMHHVVADSLELFNAGSFI